MSAETKRPLSQEMFFPRVRTLEPNSYLNPLPYQDPRFPLETIHLIFAQLGTLDIRAAARVCCQFYSSALSFKKLHIKSKLYKFIATLYNFDPNRSPETFQINRIDSQTSLKGVFRIETSILDTILNDVKDNPDENIKEIFKAYKVLHGLYSSYRQIFVSKKTKKLRTNPLCRRFNKKINLLLVNGYITTAASLLKPIQNEKLKLKSHLAVFKASIQSNCHIELALNLLNNLSHFRLEYTLAQECLLTPSSTELEEVLNSSTKLMTLNDREMGQFFNVLLLLFYSSCRQDKFSCLWTIIEISQIRLHKDEREALEKLYIDLTWAETGSRVTDEATRVFEYALLISNEAAISHAKQNIYECLLSVCSADKNAQTMVMLLACGTLRDNKVKSKIFLTFLREQVKNFSQKNIPHSSRIFTLLPENLPAYLSLEKRIEYQSLREELLDLLLYHSNSMYPFGWRHNYTACRVHYKAALEGNQDQIYRLDLIKEAGLLLCSMHIAKSVSDLKLKVETLKTILYKILLSNRSDRSKLALECFALINALNPQDQFISNCLRLESLKEIDDYIIDSPQRYNLQHTCHMSLLLGLMSIGNNPNHLTILLQLGFIRPYARLDKSMQNRLSCDLIEEFIHRDEYHHALIVTKRYEQNSSMSMDTAYENKEQQRRCYLRITTTYLQEYPNAIQVISKMLKENQIDKDIRGDIYKAVIRKLVKNEEEDNYEKAITFISEIQDCHKKGAELFEKYLPKFLNTNLENRFEKALQLASSPHLSIFKGCILSFLLSSHRENKFLEAAHLTIQFRIDANTCIAFLKEIFSTSKSNIEIAVSFVLLLRTHPEYLKIVKNISLYIVQNNFSDKSSIALLLQELVP